MNDFIPSRGTVIAMLSIMASLGLVALYMGVIKSSSSKDPCEDIVLLPSTIERVCDKDLGIACYFMNGTSMCCVSYK